MRTAYINGFPSPKINLTNDWQEKMNYLAENTGNVVYVNALRKQLQYCVETWFDETVFSNHEIQVGVMPVSNILRTGYEGTIVWADMIEKMKFPITLIGVGAQSFHGQTTPKQIVDALKPEVVRAFQRIAYQTCSLGIRGEATAECLDLMGIHNYRIIGCPSFYQYLDGVFKKRKKATKERITFNLATARKTTGHIFAMGMKNNGHWIMQGVPEGICYLCSDAMATEEFVRKKLCLSLNVGHLSLKDINEYIKSNAHVFFSQTEWDAFLQEQNFTFSFGMRFHGNMLAHLNGVPSVWIGHDLRTKELVNTLKLPNVNLEQYRDIKDIDELIDICDYSRIEKDYYSMCEEYVKFLDENGIDHRFKLT